LSGGLRYLDFDTSDVTLYTGSIGKYKGNYYFALQPYFADRDEGDMSSTLTFLWRKYGATGDDYWGIRGAYGRVPEQDILLQDTIDLDSWNARIETQHRGGGSLIWRGFFGYRNQELRSDADRSSYIIGVGLKSRH
jgi:YaiO family outer membrane protein